MVKKLFPLLLPLALFACWAGDPEPVVPDRSGPAASPYVVTDVYGRKYPTLDPSKIYCGPGWGAKMCHFLYHHDETVWTNPAGTSSDYPDIKFSNFTSPFFIAFLRVDSTAFRCESWQLGETNLGGSKWAVVIRKDRENMLWFDYTYFGSGAEGERTTTYKFERIDGLLHFSSTDGRSLVYHPSDKDYAALAAAADEVLVVGECLFY